MTQTVTPKVNTVGRPIAKAGPETRKSVADRARQEVVRRTQELKKNAAKAGLCMHKSLGTVTSMQRTLKPPMEATLALSPADPMAGSGALVSLFECTLSASMNPDCGCGEADCECEGSAADEASCPQCVKGNILKELQNHNLFQSPADQAAFNNCNLDPACLQNLFDNQNNPDTHVNPGVKDMLLAQLDLAQRTKKYENDLKSGAPESTINYDLGQLKASEQNYQNKVEAAHTAGLIAGGDEANRLQTLNDLSQTTDLLNQYHNAQGQATQPWLPGPGGGGTWIPGPGGGGLNLPEGPILIVNDPNLPAEVMTQIGPSLVAIGTGGQGDFMVQPGSPSDLGYPPPITNVPPVPEAGGAAAEQYAGQALVMNPEITGVTISFLIDQAPYSLPAGQELPLAGQPSWVIAFDRGGSLGPTSYTLERRQ